MADGSLYDILITLANEAFYAPGEGISITGAVLCGFTTSSNTAMFFSLPVGKSLANINSITGVTLRGSIRVANGGYLNSKNSASYDWLSAATWEFRKFDDYTIRLKATSSSAFTNVPNDGMVVLYTNPLELEFS